MAGRSKRKHASMDDQQSKQTASGQIQQDIKAFGSIRKPKDAGNDSKKRKTAHQRDPTPPPTLQTPGTADKKRKRSLEIVEEEDLEEDSLEQLGGQRRVFKHFEKAEVSTPRNKRFKNVQPPSPIETPSKTAAALFNKLRLDPAINPIHFALSANQQAYHTPPHIPEADSGTGLLPGKLEELLFLQSAFLSALSLYYAHNGTSSPVNVKALLPMITKNWNKRTVSLDDLRVLLAIGQNNESSFMLQDFGKAGTCLMRSQPRGRATKRAASYVDETDLNARFEDALQKKWTNWLAATPEENGNAAAFMDQLPLADITKSETVEKAAPVFQRGQQRLADLRAGQTAAKAEPAAPLEIAPEHKTNQAVQSRRTSLLDRVLAKQAHAASLPAGPTREQLERKSALHRVEEIARVLDLLAAGRPRCSFSMPAMIQQLQQSLHNPISKEEVVRCLGLMYKEITPCFLSLVQSGAVTGVVVTKSGKVGLEDLRQRVQNACI